MTTPRDRGDPAPETQADVVVLGLGAGGEYAARKLAEAGLTVVGVERDLEQFKEYFENPAFRSDGLKIYPTLVIRGTGLYELWRTGRYKNYTPNVLVDVVARILALVPPWTRVYRVQRCVRSQNTLGTDRLYLILPK